MCRIALHHTLPLSATLATLAAASQLTAAPNARAEPVPAVQVAQQSAQSAAPVSRQPVTTKQFDLTPEERGNLLMAEKRYQAAIEAFKKAPHNSAEVWNRMGIAYEQMLNPNEAMRCFLQSLKLDPRNGHVLNNLATIYVSSKDYRTAERYYRKALKLEPKSAVILKNYGTDLLMRRKYKQGGQMYAKAAAIDPLIFQGTSGFSVANPTSTENRGAMNYYLAITCARAGMKEPAIDYLRKALSEGYINSKKIIDNNEFASLRGIPAFEQLLAEQKNP